MQRSSLTFGAENDVKSRGCGLEIMSMKVVLVI